MSGNDDDLIISISTDQATLRRSIKRIEQDLGTLAGTVQKQFAAVGKSVDNSVSSSLQSRINGMVGIGTKAAKEWTGALADQGAELERLRARYSPLFATINNYKSAVSDIRRAHALGAISANEMANAIAKERQAALASTAAIKGRNAAIAATPSQRDAPQGVRSFQTANLAAQGQDILVSALGGQSASTIGFQQGTQIAPVLQQLGSGKNILQGLGAAAASLASPISIAAIGLTAAAAAAIQYGTSIFDSASKAEEILEKHEATMARIKDLYDKAADAGEQYGRRVGNAVTFTGRQDANRLELLRKSQARDLSSQLGIDFSRQGSGNTLIGKDAPSDAFLSGQAKGKYGPYAEAILKYAKAAKDGKGDIKELNDEIFKIANDNSTVKKWQEYATTLLGWTENLTKTTEAAKDLNKELFKAAAGQRGVLVNSPEYRSMLDYKSDTDAAERLGLRDMRRSNSAELSTLNARSPQERAAAARQTAAAQTIQGESDAVRNLRIQIAGEMELARAEKQRTEAQRERALSLNKSLADQQMEIDLIGKTGNAATILQKQYELISELKMEAARNGTQVDEAEIENIKKKTAELGKLLDLSSRLKLTDDLNRDRRMSTMSTREQAIVTSQRQYGLAEDPNSATGKEIGQSLDRQALQDSISSFSTDFKNELLNNGGDIGKAFGKSIQTALMNEASKLWESLFKQLGGAIAGAIFPASGGGTSAATTGVGGIAAKVFGTAPVGAVTRAALPDVGATKTGIGLSGISAANGLTAKVATEYAPRFQGLLNDLDKAGYSVKSLGEGGYSYRNVAGSNNLSKHSFGEALDINPRQNPWSTNFQTDMPSNINDLAKKNGLTWGGTWNKPDTMHFQVDKTASSASDALEKLAGSGKDASAGLSKLGQSLSTSFFPAAPSAPSGGGGFGGLFSGLFGSSLSAADVAKYTPMVGLFADGGVIRGPGSGTSDSIPTMLSDEEFVVNSKASKKHRALLHAINNGTIGHMAMGGVAGRSLGAPVAPTLASRRSAGNDNASPGILQVQIMGASGDDHVRMLVKQGVGDGLSQYNDNQRRGGFGQVQQRYQNQKV